MRDVLEFRWPVPVKGYELVDACLVGRRPDLGPRYAGMAQAPGHGEDQAWTWVEPLKNEGLFREFSELDTDAQSVRAFANRYGWLGVGEPAAAEVRSQVGGSVYRVYVAEPLERWSEEVRAMHDMVAVWDRLAEYLDGRRPHAPDLMQLEPNAAQELRDLLAKYDGDPELEAIPPKTYRPPLANPAGLAWPITVVEPERQLLRVGPASLWTTLHFIKSTTNQRLRLHTAVVMGVSDATDMLHLVVSPLNLLGALWLQFAGSIDAGARWRRCAAPDCDNWIQVSTSPGVPGRSAAARYCQDSHRCRKAAERYRRKRAATLDEQHYSVAEIARMLNVPEKSVLGYLGISEVEE